MKLISFDVGTRNLAYCVVEFTNVDAKFVCKIDAWDVLDLGGSNNSTEKCSLVLTRVLNETFKDIPSLKIDFVLIERQPKRSVSMLAVQMFLCQYFSGYVHNGHIRHVHFVSPKLKLDHSYLRMIMGRGWTESTSSSPSVSGVSSSVSSVVVRGRAKYAKNKKDAVNAVRHILEHVLIDHAKLVEFDAASKRDDLADAFLQGLCWTLSTHLSKPEFRNISMCA